MALSESGVEPFLMGEMLIENNQTYLERVEGADNFNTLIAPIMNLKFNVSLFNLLQLSKHLMNLKRKMLFLGPVLSWINLVVLWAMQFHYSQHKFKDIIFARTPPNLGRSCLY